MIKKTNIGLFFGSFNPVHVGHLALANYIAENSKLDEIWFVVSPHNPFKKSADLIDTKHRINMLALCIKNYPKFKVSDIELQLPTPSYTFATVEHLRELHPDTNFTIIMGSDNLELVMRWKNIDDILQHHPLLVYPRPEYPIVRHPEIKNLEIIEAPLFNIDSTRIREAIKMGKNYSFIVPQQAFEYLVEHKLYNAN